MHNTIGERLRHLMAERGLSAAQLAKRADIKPSFIYDVLHGKSTNPSIVKLAHIARCMDVDISSLVGSNSSSPTQNRTEPPAKSRKLQLDMHSGDDYVTISSILVEASMGGGSIVTTEEKGKPYYFRQEWIRNRLGVTADDLRMIFVRGDSMEPTLCAGDMILIDITKKSPTPPGIFVLFDGFGLVTKRLEFLSNTNPPAIRIISDNAQYAAYERTIDELHIIGRVVWFAREL
ncbi:MAG: LexA family transcriptional regulator [Alphaproteobacteria bacterium]|nr:LexA family transcriptional regulator [Alphaproteobacteria bacterium]